jgi:hypothetical protein
MAMRDFLFGFKFLATDYVSPVLKKISEQIEAVNTQVKATASWREVGTNIAMVGAGMTAMGAGVGFVLKGMINDAAVADEHLRHLSTTLDSGAAGVRELAQAHQLAAQWSVTFNYAQKDIIDNLYKSISFTGSYNAGLAVTKASLAVAKGNLGDAAGVGQSLSIMFNNWPGKIGQANAQVQHLADLVAYTSRHGAFNSVNDVTSAMSIAAGSIKAANLGPEDTMAMIQAYSRVGMVGTEAGSAIMETLSAFSKGKLHKDLGVALAVTKSGALDVIGTMVNLRHEMGSGVITVQQFQRASAALGIRGERALAVNVDAMVGFRKQLANPSLINGAAMQGAMTIMGGFSEQMGVIGQKWNILSEALGANLLGPIQSIGSAMGWVIDKVTQFVNYAPGIAKWATLAAAAGAAILVVGGGMLVATGAIFAAISFLPALATVTAIAGSAFTLLGSAATFAWAAITGPIGLAVAGIALAGFGVYEAIKHWDSISKFFRNLAHEIYQAGAHLIDSLVAGMMSRVGAVGSAISTIATKIWNYLPHSPAREGPLRGLHQIRIVETIAESIRPGPALTAIRRTAAAVAIATPMMFGTTLNSVAASAGSAGGRGGSVVINIEYKPSIALPSGANAKEVLDVLKHHDGEVVRILERRLGHQSRREL